MATIISIFSQGQTWSWVLTLIGVYGWYRIVTMKRHGYIVAGGLQFLWVAYAVLTEQWGFILYGVCYFSIAVRGFIKSREWADDSDRDRLTTAFTDPGQTGNTHTCLVDVTFDSQGMISKVAIPKSVISRVPPEHRKLQTTPTRSRTVEQLEAMSRI